MLRQSLFQAFRRPALCIFGACIIPASFTACVKQTRHTSQVTTQAARLSPPTASSAINLNTATREELERLPGIGPGLALRIIEHRERYGRFRRPEHLIMVRGLGERRFRELRSLVVAE